MTRPGTCVCGHDRGWHWNQRLECGWGPTEGDPACYCDRYEQKKGQGR